MGDTVNFFKPILDVEQIHRAGRKDGTLQLTASHLAFDVLMTHGQFALVLIKKANFHHATDQKNITGRNRCAPRAPCD